MAAPDMPIIYVPKSVETGINRNPWLVSAEYSAPMGSPGFLYADWQVASDEDFNNIVWQDMESLAEWINQVSSDTGEFIGALAGKNGLNWNTTYYLRLRWANADGAGAWSLTIDFTVMLGTDWVKYLAGGASQPIFVITGDEITKKAGYNIFRNNQFFDNYLQGFSGTMHDVTDNHVIRTAHVFGQHALRVVDDSAVAAESTYFDWIPQASSYGALIILWIKASSAQTATLVLSNAQAAFDPADVLTLKKISVTTALEMFVLYYPYLREIDYSNERRLWIFSTEVDEVTQQGTIDVCRCIIREVREELIMPVPARFDLDFEEEYDSQSEIIDQTQIVAKKGFRLTANIEYPLLSTTNETKRRKILNSDYVFFFPHPDCDWCTQVYWPGQFEKGYMGDKLFHGHEGKISIKSREIFPKKPKVLIEL